MNTPLVSVLIPVYNERPEYLARALDSIIGQTFQSIEILILDDGSDAPETLDVLRRYQVLDDRIVLHRGAHQGLTRSLNVGLGLCRSEMICRHDSDDWSDSRRLERQYSALGDNQNIGMLGCQVVLHQEDGSELWESRLPESAADVLASFPEMNPFCHGAVCFRRRAAEAVGGYRTELRCSQDYDFFWRICEKFGGENLPDALYHHRRTAASISTTKPLEQMRAHEISKRLAQLRRQGKAEDIAQAERELFGGAPCRGIPGETLLKQADQLMLAGHYRRSLHAFIRGILDAPCALNGYLKLARWGLFVLLPFSRVILFRPTKWAGSPSRSGI